MPGPERILRVGGVLVVGLVGLPEALQVLFEDAGRTQTLSPELVLTICAPVLVLCGLFWWATRGGIRGGLADHFAIAAEVALCFFTATELIHVVAAQVSVTLRPRAAYAWFAVLNTALLAFGVAAYLDGSFEPMTGISSLPKPVQAVVTLVAMTGWNLFAFAAGRLIVEERRQRLSIAELNLKLIAVREDVDRAAEERERMRIARDLHDTLGHHLTALASNLELAQRLPPDRSREVLGRTQLLARLLLSDLRETVSQLRSRSDPTIRPTVKEALVEMAARLEGAAQVEIQVDAEAQGVDRRIGEVVLQAAREAVTNSLRHAGATWVLVKLQKMGSEWLLTVTDNGRVVAPVRPGNGLNGLRERARELGGELRILPGRALTLQMRLPASGEVSA